MEAMRFSLRTLLIVMLLAGPLCAFGWTNWKAYQAWREEQAAQKAFATSKIKNAITSLRTIKPKLLSRPNSSVTAEEIWNEQKDNIPWDSFPESQPPR